MSTVITSTPIQQSSIHSATPSFPGIVRGEMFKLSRQWTTWILLVLLAGIIILPYLVMMTAPNARASLEHAPLPFLYSRVEDNLAVLRIFSGFFLLILTARVIGLEYQLGTIRILLARGVGRLQLLGAKLLAIVIFALFVLIGGLLLNALLTLAMLGILAGNLNALNALTPAFWSGIWVYVLTVMISMGATIFLAVAMNAIGRSQVFGLSAALVWFPVDNFGTLIMLLVFRLTHNDFWQNITGYFLGPLLNTMPGLLIPKGAATIGPPPLVTVDGTHALLVTLAYAIIFAVVALVLTWKRDVME
ncbi:MAG TPA: ABC transporter permease subunit [Ktedonobacteraceae bacterium]|nr:ABC transporter permease subunit [Ktedonobacteraceae bacterium]